MLALHGGGWGATSPTKLARAPQGGNFQILRYNYISKRTRPPLAGVIVIVFPRFGYVIYRQRQAV